MKILLLLLLASCSSLKQDPQMLKDIRDWNLAGKWINDTGHFRISCVANFEFYEANTFENFGMGSSEKGGWIRKLEKKKLTSGPLIGRSYKIDRMPMLVKKEWVMSLNGQEYTREAGFPICP